MSERKSMEDHAKEAALIGARRFLMAHWTMSEMARELAYADVMDLASKGEIETPDAELKESMIERASKTYLATSSKDTLADIIVDSARVDLTSGMVKIPMGKKGINAIRGLDLELGERVWHLNPVNHDPDSDSFTLTQKQLDGLEKQGAYFARSVDKSWANDDIHCGSETVTVRGVNGSAKYIQLFNKDEAKASLEGSINQQLAHRYALTHGIRAERQRVKESAPGL